MDNDPATTDPPRPAPPPAAPPRRLRRRVDGAIGGVASGAADYLRIDPVIVRIAFVVLAIAGSGGGILLYIAAWILLPDQTDRDPRPVAFNSGLASIIIGGAVLVGAVSAILGTISLGFDESVIVPILLIAGGFFLLNQRAETKAIIPGETTWPPAPPTPPGTSSPAATGTTVATMDSDSPSTYAPTEASVGPTTPQGWTSSEPTHWATPVVDPLPDTVPTGPKPPVTSVTLAVAAVGVGMLLAVGQLSSADIGAAAVFGMVAAVCGAGLIASAFIGRARPLLLVGLVALAGLSIAPVAETTLSGGLGPREYQVRSEQDIRSTYEVGSGYIELDLRRVDFTTSRDIMVAVGAGYAEIIVPADITVVVDLESRFGLVNAFGEEQSGVGSSIQQRWEGTEGAPIITIEGDVTFGAVEVRRG